MIGNTHARRFAADPARVGALIDTLSSDADALWPHRRWPAMRFDRPLGVGAIGGHGPIRYTVEKHLPGSSVRFRFTDPCGFDGWHGFDVERAGDGGTWLLHRLRMRTHGVARISWPLLYRPLHDALIEDALDCAARALGEAPQQAPYRPWVRLLRALLPRARSRPWAAPTQFRWGGTET